jgi:hypothetical protein
MWIVLLCLQKQSWILQVKIGRVGQLAPLSFFIPPLIPPNPILPNAPIWLISKKQPIIATIFMNGIY